MPAELKGSCHCGAVRFKFLSNTPVPYQYYLLIWETSYGQLCQCSICRKVGGFMGSVNIMGLTKSLSIEGETDLKSYTPKHSETGEPLTSKRFFCQNCASMLWLHDPTYTDWIYPFASAIDSPLPKAENTLTIMRSSCPDYVPVPEGSSPLQKYGDESIEEWHKSRGHWVE
ncbi:hypothetical protein FRC07_006491 [Ceratobasidium sp. 392]|nr:hypothetical protein FRC07_006491 [Ceratobasidium sp. 392]